MTRRLVAAISLISFAGALLAAPAAASRPTHDCPPASTAQVVGTGDSCRDVGLPMCASTLGCAGTVTALTPVAPVLRIVTVAHRTPATPLAALHDRFVAGPPTPPPDR